MKQAVIRYLINLGDATSSWLNAALLFGNVNESISGRAWRLQSTHWAWKYARVIIDFLASPFEDNHCQLAYDNDIKRARVLLQG